MSDLVQLRRSPHISRAIDNTALSAYNQCPWKFFASMVLHRRREGSSSAALSAGSAWHKMMEIHYKTGGDRDIVMAALAASWQPHDRPDDHRTPERLRTVYDDYIKFWGPHDVETRNNGVTVGYPDQPLVEIPVEIGWEMSDPSTGSVVASGSSALQAASASLHPYTGKIDRIIEWQGLYYVEDHKTTSALGSNYFAQFDPSNQMMGYAWLAQKMTGLPIAGVRINAVGILKTMTKLQRQIISYAPARLIQWSDNYNRLIERVEHSYKLLAEGAPHDVAFPRTWACSEKYGMCGYTEVCGTVPQRQMQVLETEFVVKPWDPMEIAEDGAEAA